MRKFLWAVVFIIFSLIGMGQSVILDAGFGNKGLVYTDYPSKNYNPFINNCRQLLLHTDGSFYLVLEINLNTIVAHYYPNGVLDTTYGDNGYSAPLAIRITRAALRPNGKIVFGGFPGLTETPLNEDFRLTQLDANGLLDLSFGNKGYVKTDFFNENDNLKSISLQNDGRIVAAGFADSASIRCFALARYEPDGSLDTSFSGDGRVVSALTQTNNIAFAVAIQPNYRILAGGVSGDHFAVARYKEDGSKDSSFNSNGELTISIGDASQAKTLIVQPDGKIIAGGISNSAATRSDFTILRLNEDGSLDNTFSADGIQTTDFGNTIDVLESMALQPDGRIVVSGTTAVKEYGDIIDILIARYTTDGLLDNSFSDDGYLIRSLDEFSDHANSVVVQPDNKLLIAGNTNLRACYLVMRYEADGTPDNDFGSAGLITSYWPVGTSSLSTIGVLKDGSIATGGNRSIVTANGLNAEFFIARFKSNGAVDSSFGSEGSRGLGFSIIYPKMIIQPDGKYLIGGNYFLGLTTLLALTRLNPDGSTDSSFYGGGLMLDSPITSSCYFTSMALLSNGKIILSGTAYPKFGSDASLVVVRYNSDGTRDSTFSGDGIVNINVNSWGDWAKAMVIRPDGKIVMFGASGPYPTDMLIAQINEDGSPDMAFGNQGIRLITLGQNNVINSAALLPDGRFFLSTLIQTNNHYDEVFMRFNANGTPDSSYANMGRKIINLGATGVMIVQPDGKIISGGSASLNGKMLLVRFNTDGSLDSSFSEDGYWVHNVGYGSVSVIDLIIDGNRLYAVGSVQNVNTRGLIAAFLPDQVAEPLLVAIPDTQPVSHGTSENTVYIGYEPASSLTLQVRVSGGKEPYSYAWSNGLNTPAITVSPKVSTTYIVTVTDAAGQINKASKEIRVMDVRCGNKMDKTTLFYSRNRTDNCYSICTPPRTVKFFLNNGWQLGHCTGSPSTDELKMIVYPNPAWYEFNVKVQSNTLQKVELIIHDICGHLMEKRIVSTNSVIQLGRSYRPGIYKIEARYGSIRETAKLIKLPR